MEGGWDDYLFGMNVQNIFFQLPKLNKYCLGVELDPVHQAIRKAQNESFAGLHAVFPLHAATATECDKKQKGHASY